jgi:glycosyltransferase involved in cell wall biosynthesis
LSKEFGAAQTAINLKDSFESQEHEVVLWTPMPLPPGTRGWQENFVMRSKLAEFLSTQSRFDILDLPAPLVCKQASKSANVVVARSVGNGILYMVQVLLDLRPISLSLKSYLRYMLTCLSVLVQIGFFLDGWARASKILCMGTLEYRWMRKWFPFWNSKLSSYRNTLSKPDRQLISQLRLNRKQRKSPDGVRFLWIGRWVRHKGNDTLMQFIKERSRLNAVDTFTIAGCGEQAYQDCPPELVGSGRLTIIPKFKYDELFCLLENHDVGLFTSRVEGWGLSLIEMLESGMTVFATYAGGVPDMEPYFPKTLHRFPPPVQIELESESEDVLSEYYRTFNYDLIGKLYLQQILSIGNTD